MFLAWFTLGLIVVFASQMAAFIRNGVVAINPGWRLSAVLVVLYFILAIFWPIAVYFLFETDTDDEYDHFL